MTDYKTLIRLTVEIEGLLRVLAERDTDDKRELLGEKFAVYKQYIDALLAGGNAPEAVQKAEDVAQALTLDEVKDEEAVDAEDEDEIDLATAAIERGENENDQAAEAAEEVAEDAHDAGRAAEETVRVDQALSRNAARDLRRAFTLNDKFRFRRYLFNNDDTKFAETLDRIQAMASYDEARAYLIDTLGWDAQSDEVKDFLAIVENHFA